MSLISVIIPVYKVEAYLSKCVNSVLNQDFRDFEVILVDDGSPDQCPAICDDFARKDSRVKVVHKNNGGLSDARNAGIKAATGEYLMFLDSDDFWEGSDCLDHLSNRMITNNADVILYGTKDINLKDSSEVISRGFYDINSLRQGKEEAVKSLFETNQFPGSAWVIAIKKSLVLEKHLFFVKGIKSEDIDWLMNVFSNAKTFDGINVPFYMYVKNRPGAITTTSDLKSGKDILYSVAKWTSILENELTLVNRLLLSYLAYQYVTSYIIFSKISITDKNVLLPELKENIGILQYARGRRTLLTKKLIELFGIKISSYFFKSAHSAMNKWPSLKRLI